LVVTGHFRAITGVVFETTKDWNIFPGLISSGRHSEPSSFLFGIRGTNMEVVMPPCSPILVWLFRTKIILGWEGISIWQVFGVPNLKIIMIFFIDFFNREKLD